MRPQHRESWQPRLARGFVRRGISRSNHTTVSERGLAVVVLGHLAPRSGLDLHSGVRVDRVLVDFVAARTVVASERLKQLDRVKQDGNGDAPSFRTPSHANGTETRSRLVSLRPPTPTFHQSSQFSTRKPCTRSKSARLADNRSASLTSVVAAIFRSLKPMRSFCRGRSSNRRAAAS
jgi:hypothetical protein